MIEQGAYILIAAGAFIFIIRYVSNEKLMVTSILFKKFINKFDIFHEKKSTSFNIGSYLLIFKPPMMFQKLLMNFGENDRFNQKMLLELISN